jgi:hypothetical protein
MADPKSPEVVALIRSWVAIDNKRSKIKADLEEETAEKKALEERIAAYVEENALESLSIDVGAEQAVTFVRRAPPAQPAQAATQSFLLDTLRAFYDDANDTDAVNVERLIAFFDARRAAIAEARAAEDRGTKLHVKRVARRKKA